MKAMKTIITVCCALLFVTATFAQGAKDPSTWTIRADPENGLYRVIFHVSLDKGWHIWSLTPGGDGTLIPPSFTFNKGSYSLAGEIGEQGMATEMNFEGVDGKVRFYMAEAQFTQLIKAHSGDVVKGEYTYQLCSETTCLAPKTKPFQIRIP